MTKSTTHEEKYSGTETLLASFELSEKVWKVAFTTGYGQQARKRDVPARDMSKVWEEIQKAKKRFGVGGQARVVCCYEAGRDGFWIARELKKKEGVEVLVVDSASIEVNRRRRRAKTDRLDAEKLLDQLIRYEAGNKKVWKVVRIPSKEEEDRRQLHRELSGLKTHRTRLSNHIRGLLASQGIRVGGTVGKVGEEYIEGLRTGDGDLLGSGMKERLKRAVRHWNFVHSQILSLEGQRREEMRQDKAPDMAKIRQLQQLKAVGENGSWVVVREFGWRQLRNGRQVGGLSGLVGTPYQSGSSSREQGISKAGNRRVRAVAIELAWCWVRYQPNSKLTRWYRERFGGAGKRSGRIGIVAVARRLLIALWRYMETGELPEGAELKA